MLLRLGKKNIKTTLTNRQLVRVKTMVNRVCFTI
jgi:hypothetical protein